jgi:hypothetical protein
MDSSHGACKRSSLSVPQSISGPANNEPDPWDEFLNIPGGVDCLDQMLENARSIRALQLRLAMRTEATDSIISALDGVVRHYRERGWQLALAAYNNAWQALRLHPALVSGMLRAPSVSVVDKLRSETEFKYPGQCDQEPGRT